MSKLSDLKARIHTLGEIKNILNAMKNLSLVEITKISRFLSLQGMVSNTIQEILADFEFFYGPSGVGSNAEGLLCVLIGSERGFCGGFNEQIAGYFQEKSFESAKVRILTVGRKLAVKFEQDPRLVGTMEGPSTSEEIPITISNLCDRLKSYSAFRWLMIHHDTTEGRSNPVEIYPLETRTQQHPILFPFSPLLNLDPQELYPMILEQHLFEMLYNIFYDSFMAENRERLRHMDAALQKIEKDWGRMKLRANSLRQESITEELEIILLSVGVEGSHSFKG